MRKNEIMHSNSYNLSIFIICLLIILIISCLKQREEYHQGIKESVDYVNPLIGTAAGNGGTIPGVTRPFGMTQFVAMTRENRIGQKPYYYEDATINGFIATHQPAVWMGDYGYVSLMPGIGDIKTTAQDRKLYFSHKKEISTPFYYSIELNNDEDKDIKAEITATMRCGFMKFTFPRSQNANFIIEVSRDNQFDGFVRINIDLSEIIGYNSDRFSAYMGPELNNFKGYFVIQFNKRFKNCGTWNNDEIATISTARSKNKMGAYVSFSTDEREIILVKIGTSFISIEQARANLTTEIPDWRFQKVKNDSREEWQKRLNKIEIEGTTANQQTIFYTAMYHSLLYPRTFSEYGKYYSAFDDTIHDGVSYTDYSLWDTFRALHPLLLFTAPDHVNPMITSLLQMYEQGGWLPKWPNPTYTNIKIGTHADAVIADAYIKGFRGFDVEKAYQAIRKNAFIPPIGDRDKSSWRKCPWRTFKRRIPKNAGNAWWDRAHWTAYEARGGLTWYDYYGYVPVDKTRESISRTLEFAYDDFCVAQMAKALNKIPDYEYLIRRSKNYKNLYNFATGFMAPRLSDGTWSPDTTRNIPPIGPEQFDGFTEGGPWTYLFCAMQDIPGLIQLMGGNEKFAKKLDQNFSEGHYRHDEVPGHHYIYLYDYCGQPWKTQELVRKLINFNYHNRPDGINGNENCGQMSAWYIFSMMGFYPVTPGSGVYAIGAPQLENVTLNLERNRKFKIIAKNLSEINKYIQSATLNGKPLNRAFINHSDIVNGNSLVFVMAEKPNKQWK